MRYYKRCLHCALTGIFIAEVNLRKKFMNTRRNTLISIVAMLLILVLIGLPSMRFVQKLSAGCPFSQTKSVLSCNPCMYRTVASPIETGDLLIAALPPVAPDILPLTNISEKSIGRDVIIASNPLSEVTPLRC